MELVKQIQIIRSECEEYFYMFSAIMNRSKAEKAALLAYKKSLESKIEWCKEHINLCDNVINDYSHKSGLEQYKAGMKMASEARKKTHESEIALMKKKIEIIELNLIC